MKLRLRKKKEEKPIKEKKMKGPTKVEYNEDNAMKDIEEEIAKQRANKPVRSINQQPVTLQPVTQKEQQPETIKSKPDLLRDKIKEFNNDYSKFYEWAINNLNPKESFDAGFQVAMDLYNIWIERYYNQKEVVNNLSTGKIDLPLDPRGPTPLELLFKLFSAAPKETAQANQNILEEIKRLIAEKK